MRKREAQLTVTLSLVAEGLLFVVSCIFLFSPSALFPYYNSDFDADSFTQGRHDKLVDKPLFIMSGGILLSQVLAISFLLLPMTRDTLGTAKDETMVVLCPMSLPLMQLASLMIGLTGIALVLAGSMLIEWDGDKGNDSAPLIVLGFLVMVCSIVTGLVSLVEQVGAASATVDTKRLVVNRKLSESITTVTWREISDGECRTPQSCPRPSVSAMDHADPSATSLAHQDAPRKDVLSIARSKSITEPEPTPAIRINLISTKEGPTNVPLPSSFVLPMVTPRQPPVPALPIQQPTEAVADPWDDNYQKLLEFHAKHGHCKVLHGTLAGWLAKQRKDYQTLVHQLVRPVNCELNSDRIDLLNALSIDWMYNEEEEWNERHCQLKEYYAMFGTIGMSPSSSNHSPSSSRQAQLPLLADDLKEWMRRQQDEYKLWKIKAPTSMTIERILRLQALRFVWDDTAAVSRVPTHVSFDDEADAISALV